MKRQIVYPGAIPLETDILSTNKNVMIAIGHLLQDMIGTSTLYSGLGCVATAPAGMTVNVNQGRAYSLQATDTGAYSSLAADAHQIMKQGILLDAVNFSCPAPTTAGFSINYLIEGAFQEVDAGSVVLPYYNAANPAQAYSGPNGTGTSNTTYRDNTIQLQIKAGVAAATGTQVTPTPDAGFNGLWVVTVAFGATTITSGNISQYSGAPFLSAALLAQIQAIPLHGISRFTASGSFTVPAGVTTIYLSATAGGGGGSAGGGSTTSQIGSGGGGGGAGQSVIRAPYTVTPGQVIAITVGAAGTAGAGAFGAGGGGGTAGGTTLITGLQSLAGGQPGFAGVLATSGSAGGATGGTGYPNGTYGSDTTQGNASGNGGGGASGPFGGGGGGGAGRASGATGGVNAFGFGSGGGGGGGAYAFANTAAGGNGGAGSPGLVIIEW
jgi:hypothetical protein